MKFENDYCYDDISILYDKCKKFLYYHVLLTIKDGSMFDGIIKNVNTNRIIVLVGKNIIEPKPKNIHNQQRQYNQNDNIIQIYRRFDPQSIPLNALTGLYLLPYPFISPQYPFYPFHPAYHL